MFYHQYFNIIQYFLEQTLGLYSIQNYIEVSFFILCTYRGLMWLKQDHTKNVLLWSYGYISLLAISYLSSCSILFLTLLVSIPAYIMFIIVIHQKQIQKNFVLSSKTHFSLQANPQSNWIETLVQSCLLASHAQKNIICIIERSQHLQPLLTTPYLLQIPIQQDVTNLLLSSSKINQDCILWIQESGIIQSINVSWGDVILNELIVKPQNNSSLIHEASMILTEKTDALIFSIQTTSNSHLIWHKGIFVKQATITHLLKTIRQILDSQNPQNSILKSRSTYDQRNNFT